MTCEDKGHRIEAVELNAEPLLLSGNGREAQALVCPM